MAESATALATTSSMTARTSALCEMAYLPSRKGCQLHDNRLVRTERPEKNAPTLLARPLEVVFRAELRILTWGKYGYAIAVRTH